MTSILKSNLQALRSRDPALADRLAGLEPAAGVAFEPARREEALSAVVERVDESGSKRRVTLASRHAPLDEAKRLAEQADLESHAAVLMLGAGLGHHLAALTERMGQYSLLVVYEPDEALLRAVLERVDLSAVLRLPQVVLLAGEVDGAQITGRLERYFGHISQGVQILTHPPTRQMHGPTLSEFSEQFKKFVAYCRTNVGTTLAKSVHTCRNLANNLGHYAAGATINDLRGAAKGYPAILVAAGPSLARNVHLLAERGVRDHAVIIAVQTVLKPLLERGVRPHYVTALDYHEISRRFYEGLPELPDVTLVAEPKSNKAILDHFPGPIRVCRSSFLDTLLGPEARPTDALPGGSTVAHLSLYLAQHLGCDPIVLIGQDLGFSDGLYYLPGTAIHDVWAPELSMFNTLEMMEWKRVVRHRRMLHRMTDVRDQPIYSDEQMVTYLRQFERDFAAAEQQIIDATEGGLPKASTTRMTLAEALDAYAQRPLPDLPRAAGRLDPGRLSVTAEHLARRRDEVAELARTSRETMPILHKMIEHQRDGARMRKLFEKLEKHKKTVASLKEAFALVNDLNQIGAFKRARADRSIYIDDQMDEYERQRRQLERDIENLKWLVDACEQTLEIFREAADRIDARLAAARREARAEEVRA